MIGLPCLNAARQWSTAAIGLPVHSAMTSMPGCAMRASQSSPTWVLPFLIASSMDKARDRSALQPTRSRLARAPATERSAMAARCTPGVRGTCARYMEPNLPAPIRPTRIGRPCAARSCNFVNRFMEASVGLPWLRAPPGLWPGFGGAASGLLCGGEEVEVAALRGLQHAAAVERLVAPGRGGRRRDFGQAPPDLGLLHQK